MYIKMNIYTEQKMLILEDLHWNIAKMFIQFWGTRYCLQEVKKLTSFNNNLLNNNKIRKPLASSMFRILSPFDFQKTDCDKVLEALN